MQSQKREFKHIVIVGGGPIGMYTALKLKNLGLNVLLIEERTNFTRPGSIDTEIFSQVGFELNEDITPSSSRHIKDLERNLHQLLLKKKIEQKQGSFVNLTSSGVEIKLPSGKVEICPCDLILDATGSKRQVILALNKILQDKKEDSYFKMNAVGDNPIKSHFIAYVGMDSKDAKELASKSELLDTLSIETNTNVHNTISEQQLIDLAELRDKFNWPYFCVPQLMAQALEKNKVCLYLETPPDLKNNQQEAWVKALIKLIAGKDIPFSYLKISDKYKAHPKPRFNKFHAQVKEVFPKFYSSQDWKPAVIPIGDALIEPDYRLGIGIREGTKRVDVLIDYFESKNGVVSGIDFQKYVENIEPLLDSQRDQLKELYTRRSSNLIFEPGVFFKKYVEVKSQETRDLIFHARIKDLPLEEKVKICTDLADALYKKALDEFKNTVLSHEDNIQKSKWAALHHSYDYLADGLRILEESKQRKPTKILQLMTEIAVKTKIIATLLFKGDTYKEIASKPALAQKHYIFALNIYDKHFSNQFNKEFLALCCNITITAEKLKDPNLAIYYADMALARLEKIPTPNVVESRIVINIMHNKIVALLQLSGALNDIDKLQKVLEEINRILSILNSGTYQTLAKEMKAIPMARKTEAQYNRLVEMSEPSKNIVTMKPTR